MTATESTDQLPDLFDFVRASERDRTFVNDCKARASRLVNDRVSGAEVPDSVLSAALLEVGANLYQRRMSSIGTSSYGNPETMGNPMRPALDPMTPAWPLLRPYLGPGLA